MNKKDNCYFREKILDLFIRSDINLKCLQKIEELFDINFIFYFNIYKKKYKTFIYKALQDTVYILLPPRCKNLCTTFLYMLDPTP